MHEQTALIHAPDVVGDPRHAAAANGLLMNERAVRAFDGKSAAGLGI
jgi:hypothetical protein